MVCFELANGIMGIPGANRLLAGASALVVITLYVSLSVRLIKYK